MKLKSKILFAFLFTVLLGVLLFVLYVAAVMSLKTSDMKEYDYTHFTIFSEDNDKDMLNKMNTMLDETYQKASVYFNVDMPKTKIYIYKNQSDLQNKKYPIISSFFDLDWYIGDNVKDSVILVSPNTEVNGHSYESIIGAAPHEVIHTIVYRLNRNCKLWVNEGLALYLSNRTVEGFVYNELDLPKIELLNTSNSIEFADNNGYQYSDKFIEFIEYKYGAKKVLELINAKSYEVLFGTTESLLYNEWKLFLKERYK